MERIAASPTGTGGFFSVGYIVEEGGTRGFLKAIDFTKAVGQQDPALAMKEVIDAFVAFSLASSGQIDKAEKVFERIKYSNIRDDSERIAITATQGLLLFRRGYADEGRLFYHRAIDVAKKLGFKKSVAVGSIYLAREEARLATEEADKAIQNAYDESKKLSDADLPVLLNTNLRTYLEKTNNRLADQLTGIKSKALTVKR